MADNISWIWRKGKVLPHEFVRFQKTFSSGNETAELKISADSDFIAYLDGTEILRGQFSDYPADKTYTTAELPLQTGEHTLEISVYYCGLDFQTYIPGPPGLWTEIRLSGGSIGSDESWLCRPETAWRRERLDKVTPQLGMTFDHDARQEEQPEPWEHAAAAEQRPEPSERPVPPLETGTSVSGRLAGQGCFIRTKKGCSSAESCQTDRLYFLRPHQILERGASSSFAAGPPPAPWRMRELPDGFDGFFLIFDLGQEYAGLETFDWEFPAGTVVEIAFGEHLTDGRVRCFISDRNFADRYVAGTGRKRFTLPRRIGGRYLELHIQPPQPGLCAVYEAGLLPRRAVLPEPSVFSCDDGKLMHLCRNSVRTLELCMHEHYEDCPWREQALYAYDSRNQILYGNYIWNNHRFAAASLELLGKGLREDGLLALCAPSRIAPPIPVFSFAWIMEICEYVLFSGDRAFADRFSGVCRKIIDSALSRFDAERGLYCTAPGETFWNFYEWREGLHGDGAVPGEPDALYNLHFLEALSRYSELAGDRALAEKAESLRKAVFREYWNAERGCLMTYDGSETVHELTQVLALYLDCVPAKERKRVVGSLRQGKFVPVSYSSMRYYYEALLPEGPEIRNFLAEKLKKDFGMMISGESGTMWETDLGDADFENAGSLCHGWSALPVWYFYVCKLGLRPLDAGWKRFLVAPVEFSGELAFGEVPTPAGKITVKIGRSPAGLSLECRGPAELAPVFRPWSPESYTSITWNGVRQNGF